MAKTLTEIRKATNDDTANMVRGISKLFVRIAKDNPQAIKDAFSGFLKTKTTDEQDRMVTFYADNAEMLIELFDLR